MKKIENMIFHIATNKVPINPRSGWLQNKGGVRIVDISNWRPSTAL